MHQRLPAETARDVVIGIRRPQLVVLFMAQNGGRQLIERNQVRDVGPLLLQGLAGERRGLGKFEECLMSSGSFRRKRRYSTTSCRCVELVLDHWGGTRLSKQL